MAHKAVHVVISGKVQGVWYRAWTVEEASKRALDGWVRNRRDGTVEAVFAGEDAAVDAMLAACREGTAQAVVTGLDVEPWTQPLAPGFRQLSSA